MGKGLAGILLAAAIAAAIWMAFLGADSTRSIVAQWTLLALITIALALWIWIELKPASIQLEEHIQAFSAIFTVIAVFIAAGIYFLEGRDKIRLSFALETNVVRLANGDSPRQVLLAIRVPVENRGQREVTIRCLGVDVQHPDARNPGLTRSRHALEEMQLVRSQAEPIAYETTDLRECIRQTAIRHRASPNAIRPLFMWPQLSLRPGEIDDIHFELPISCALPFVRVLLKIRVNPDDRNGYETKTIVPLGEICAGEVDMREGISIPSLGTGGDTETASGEEPSAQDGGAAVKSGMVP